MNEMIICLVTVALIFVLLVLDAAEPLLIFFGALMVLVITGVIDMKDALAGLTNDGMLTIAVLFVLMGAVQKNGNIYLLASKLFGSRADGSFPQLRVMLPVTAISAFINNTPLVAAFIPIVRRWSLEHGVSPSKFLIPLSYASLFGGLLTVVGTSTNLVVSGLLNQYGYRQFTMFEIGYVGLPVAILAVLYMARIGHRLLPANEDLLESFKKKQREYLVEFRVEPGCEIAGRSVQNAGLRNLKGLFLVEIIRADRLLYPVKPVDTIEHDDTLVFSGDISTIVQLQEIKGFRLLTSAGQYVDRFKNGDAHIVEAVISDNFPFLGQTIKETNFRSRYDAAVVAILRNGERLKQKLGTARLQTGDTLLMLTGSGFLDRWADSRDFFIVNKAGDYTIGRNSARDNLPVVLFLILIILNAVGLLSLLEGALMAVFFLLITKRVTLDEAKKAVDWNTLLLIVFSIGIGTALSKSGAATLIAKQLVAITSAWGPVMLIAAIYLMTNVITALLSNNAAAVLVFPIALGAAVQMGIDPKPVAIAVAIAASADFSTPFGYQTNLMVYGPGGYKFKDYVRVGLPLNFIYGIASVILIPIIWPL